MRIRDEEEVTQSLQNAGEEASPALGCGHGPGAAICSRSPRKGRGGSGSRCHHKPGRGKGPFATPSSQQGENRDKGRAEHVAQISSQQTDSQPQESWDGVAAAPAWH